MAVTRTLAGRNKKPLSQTARETVAKISNPPAQSDARLPSPLIADLARTTFSKISNPPAPAAKTTKPTVAQSARELLDKLNGKTTAPPAAATPASNTGNLGNSGSQPDARAPGPAGDLGLSKTKKGRGKRGRINTLLSSAGGPAETFGG